MVITDNVIVRRLRDVPAGVKDGKSYPAYCYLEAFTEGELDPIKLYVEDDSLKAKLRSMTFDFGDVLKVNVEKKNGKMRLTDFAIAFRLREHLTEIELFETEEV